MRRYIIRQCADADIDEIADYLGVRNLDAGRRFLEATWHEFDFLAENPGAGAMRETAPETLRGLRSWPIKGFGNYLIFYLRASNHIEIVRVLHGARNVDRILNE